MRIILDVISWMALVGSKGAHRKSYESLRAHSPSCVVLIPKPFPIFSSATSWGLGGALLRVRAWLEHIRARFRTVSFRLDANMLGSATTFCVRQRLVFCVNISLGDLEYHQLVQCSICSFVSNHVTLCFLNCIVSELSGVESACFLIVGSGRLAAPCGDAPLMLYLST